MNHLDGALVSPYLIALTSCVAKAPPTLCPIPKAAGDEKWQVSAVKGTVPRFGRGTMADVKIRSPWAPVRSLFPLRRGLKQTLAVDFISLS